MLLKSFLLSFFCWIILFANIASAQIDCNYAFEFSTTTPYTPLAVNPPVITLASGADLPSDPFDISPTDEDFFPNINLGFNFNFNGNTYSKIGITTNGWIWFGSFNPVKAGGVLVPFTNVLLTDMPFDGIVSALNGDLQGRWNADLAAIRCHTSGTAPNRRFTVEWNNFKANDPGEGTGYCGVNRNRFDFQIILYEGSNRIEFAYNMEPYCYQGYHQFFQVGLRADNNKNVHARSVSAILNGWSASKLGFPDAKALIKSSNPKVLAPVNARFAFFPAAPEAREWIGVNNNWFDPQNWTGGKVPFRCNDVNIPSNRSHYPELSGNEAAECKNLNIAQGASLTFKTNYQSFLSCFGNLVNEGVISNNTLNYLSLCGGENCTIGGSGSFLGTDFFITARSSYRIQNDLVIRNLSINEGAALFLGSNILNVYSLMQQGLLNQEEGILVIEGDAASVMINDSTFNAGTGTTFFGNGEIWNNPANQVVPSANYHNLWVRTNKDYQVTIGTHRDFSAKNLLFYNPGAAGGRAITAKNIALSGNLELGIDSLPGTELILDHQIIRPDGQGVFQMGNTDHLRVRRNTQGMQIYALNGFGSPVFTGDVSYESSAAQVLIKGKYNNLTIKGSGSREINEQVDVEGVLKVEDGVLQTNDQLTIKSKAEKTGLISAGGNGIIQGNVNIERYIHGEGNGMQLFSSAFSNALLGDLTMTHSITGSDNIGLPSNATDPSPAFWKYDNSLVDQNFHQGFRSYLQASAQLKKTEAYAIMTQAGETLKLKGAINSGIIKAPLKANPTGEYNISGWNLIGNPYPSPIDWNKVTIDAPQSMHKACYTASANKHFAGNYSVYLPLGNDGGLGINGAAKEVMSLEGFFVKSDETDTLTFKNDHRTENTSKSAVSISDDFAYLRLRLVRENIADETIIYFNENNDNSQFQPHKDALKALPVLNGSYLASRKNVHKLAIQSREVLQATDTIPLIINAAQQGSYQIRLAELVNLNPTTTVFLEDRLSGNLYNLSQQPLVNLFFNQGTSDGRYFLQVRAGVSVNTVKETCEGGDGRINIFNPSNTAWEYSLYNNNDELVESHGTFSGQRSIGNLPAGVYNIIFTLETENIEVIYETEVPAGSGVQASISSSAYEVSMDFPEVILTAVAENAQNFFWNFGDGMMSSGLETVNHVYQQAGEYQVILTATRDECSDTASIIIMVHDDVTSIGETPVKDISTFVIYPNPTKSIARIRLDFEQPKDNMQLLIVDISGKTIRMEMIGKVNPGYEIPIDVNQMQPGIYQVILSADGYKSVSKLIVSGK
jgi:PKD repeat protein